jgi:hypothetical protein
MDLWDNQFHGITFSNSPCPTEVYYWVYTFIYLWDDEWFTPSPVLDLFGLRGVVYWIYS